MTGWLNDPSGRYTPEPVHRTPYSPEPHPPQLRSPAPPSPGPSTWDPADRHMPEGQESMRPAPAALPRFAQLTYTSFDNGDGSGGGWQVKDIRGELTAGEQQFLWKHAPTRIEGPALAAIPNAEELAALPRRLVYAPVPGERAAYWHSVPAGADSTGRPGNVFSHVLLDRRPSEPDLALRPTDLLGAAQWLRPFGASLVLEATLDGTGAPPWDLVVLDRAAAVEFLVEMAAGFRRGVLAALLDGVHAAMNGGPAVVLGVANPSDAARWIAGVSHLMSPGTSRALYWACGERAAGVAALRKLGVHLAVLPAADLLDIEPADGLILINDDEDTVDLGDLHTGQPHTTRPGGASIRVTPWSVIAPEVLQDAYLAQRAMEIQDSVAAEVGDRDLACGWPLAMAVVHLPDELAEAVEEAKQLLTGPAPAGLRSAPGLLRRLMDLYGPTAEDALAWCKTLESCPASERAFAANTYLGRALRDRTWLARTEGVPVPEIAVGLLDPALSDQAYEALDLARTEAASPEGAVVAVRLLDVLVRAGLADSRTRSMVELVTGLLELVGPMLTDAGCGRPLVGRIGSVDPETQAAFVRPWLDQHLDRVGGRPGDRLAPAVLSWLYPTPPAAPGPEILRPDSAAVPATLAELAAQVTRVVADPSAFRALAISTVLDRGGNREDIARDVTRLAAGPPLTMAELSALLAGSGPLPLVPVVRRALLTAPQSADLSEVVRRVLDGELRPYIEDTRVLAVLQAAELRKLARQWWKGPGEERFTRLAAGLLDVAESVLAADPAVELATDLQISLVAAHAAHIVCRPAEHQPRLHVEERIRVVAPGGIVPGKVANYLFHAIERGALLEVDVAVAAQLGSAAPGAGRFGPPRLHQLGRMTVHTDHVEPLLDHVVRLRLRNRNEGTAAELMDAVRHEVARTAGEHAGHLDVDRELAGHDQFARLWWTGVGVPVEDFASGSVMSRWRGKRESGDLR